jgi:GH24 family phage-related lysozyme (muramidase)
MTRASLFDLIRPWLDGNGFTPARITALDAWCDANGVPTAAEAASQPVPVPPPSSAPPAADAASTGLTARGVAELAGHEGLLYEAYKDSVGVWTWGIGVTNASGHEVYPRYKDQAQTLSKCLEVYIWLVEQNYLPAVRTAFKGRELSEAQLHAALSFHYNTGAIGVTSWVPMFLNGDLAGSENFLRTHYLNGGDLQDRRNKEADLFFHGKWSGNGKVTTYQVSKPSYAPNWGSAKAVDVTAELGALLS